MSRDFKLNLDTLMKGIDVHIDANRPKVPIIGICGAKRHGKDSVAKAIKYTECPNIILDSVAYPIHKFCEDNFDYDIFTEQGKEDPIEWLEGPNSETVTLRKIMTLFGTELGREMIDPDLWVKLQLRRMAKLGALDKFGFCNPSVRFENEAQAIKQLGGKIIYVFRPGLPIDLETHAKSEMGIPTSFIDGIIINDGSLEQLATKVSRLLFDLKLEARE